MLTTGYTRDPAAPARLSTDLDLRLLSEIGTRTTFCKGMEIGLQDQPCTHLYVLVEGQVLLSRQEAGGDSYALYLLGPGDLFGEGSLRPQRRWMASARAVTDGRAFTLPAGHLPRLAQFYPDLMTQILTMLGAGVERAHRRLDLIQAPGAHERITRLLGIMAEYHGEPCGDEVRLPMRITQAELGNMVGLARETVARVFADLEAQHLIRRQGRHSLWLRRAYEPAP